MASNIANISLNTAEALLPTAYSLQSVTLENHAGRSVDINQLVTDFSITESIYRPSLLLSLNIRDPINLMEEFQLTGQEFITVVVARKPYGSYEEQRITLKFIVTEYPLFGRVNNRLQVYTLKGVSPHAYISELKKISRAFSGDVKDFIRQVLVNDLGVNPAKILISGNSTALVKFIVPNLAPLDAIHWALRRAFDPSGSPFYFYQRFDGMIVLQNHADLAAQPSYKEYEDAVFWRYNPFTETAKDYEDIAKRIISLISDVRLSKYASISQGAYSSRSDYLDLGTKTLKSSTFNYSTEFSNMKWMDKYTVVSPSFVPSDSDDNNLSEFTNSRINYIPTNSLAFDIGQNYHAPTTDGVLNKQHSYIENLDNISHDVTVAGDFKLQSGTMVSLKLPPAIDPGTEILNSKITGSNTEKDNYFSGKYLVTSVMHKFSDKYFSEVKIKRDSLPFKLS